MKRFVIGLIICSALRAAIGVNTVWNVQPLNGSDSNGGGFTIGASGTDFSATDLAVNAGSCTSTPFSGTASVTSSSFNSSSAWKFIKVTAGAGATLGYYLITAAGSGTATLANCPAAGGSTGISYSQYSGIDFALSSTTPHVNINNSSVTATTPSSSSNTLTFTSGYTPAAADVGNIVNISGGTNISTGCYEITAQTSNTWTLTGAQNLTTSSGAGSAVTGVMGGPMASIGKAGGCMVAANTILVKAEETISTAASIAITTGVSVSASGPYSRLIGYSSAPGDNGMVTIQGSTNTGLTLLNVSASSWDIENFVLDCNSLAGCTGLADSSTSLSLYNVKVINWATGINVTDLYGLIRRVEVTSGQAGCAAGVALGAEMFTIENSVIHDNPCPAIKLTSEGAFIEHNLIYNATGSTTDCIVSSGSIAAPVIVWNTIHGCGEHGINLSSANSWLSGAVIKNNLITGAGSSSGSACGTASGTGYAIYAQSAYRSLSAYDENAFWNNASGNRYGIDDQGSVNPIDGVVPHYTKSIALTSSPYNNCSGGNFTLNNTTGGGAGVRAMGSALFGTSASPYGYTSAPDIGAFQSSGSGGAAPIL